MSCTLSTATPAICINVWVSQMLAIDHRRSGLAPAPWTTPLNGFRSAASAQSPYVRRMSPEQKHPHRPPSLRERYGYLPAPLVMVLDAAGEDAMLRLVAAMGGLRLSVGRAPTPDCPLTRAVGLEAAQAIHARLSAEHITHIDVPVMARTSERDRQRRVVDLRAAGTSIANIARQTGLTERGVYLVLARHRRSHEGNPS